MNNCSQKVTIYKRTYNIYYIYVIYVHKICNVVFNAPITMKFFITFLRAWNAFSIKKFTFSINIFFEPFSRGEIALKFPNLKFKICS